MRFRLTPTCDTPTFSIAPFSTRMISGYRDRAGRHHLFTDVIDHDRKTAFDSVIDSWDTKIGYYSSPDLKTFAFHAVVVEKGRWTGDVGTSDLDCIGAASPGITVAGDRILLFYAGRGPVDPAGPFVRSTGLPNLPGRIMLAAAPADSNGAPAGPFVKEGPVSDFDAPWRSLRHDDPCATVVDDEIFLFYKGIQRAEAFNTRVMGLATTTIDQPAGPYRHHPNPVLSIPGGGETPRVFKVGKQWHMFTLRYRNLEAKTGRVYAHYVADEPTHWTLADECVYESKSPVPGQGAADMCPIWTPFEKGPPKLAFAVRLDDGTFGDEGRLKQWLYRIERAE